MAALQGVSTDVAPALTLHSVACVVDAMQEAAVVSGAPGRILYANHAVADQLGCSATRLMGHDRAVMVQVVSLLCEEPFHAVRALNGSRSSARLRIKPPGDAWLSWSRKSLGPQLHIDTFVRESGVQSQALASLAYRDELTGLLNRRGMLRASERTMERFRRDGRGFCVAAFDMDGLKRLNDQSGHGAGDDALRAIAKALGEATRQWDFVGRWGGDEFVALFPETPEAAARRAVQRVLGAVAKCGVSLSAGLAASDRHRSFAEVLAQADARAYEAKSRGGGQLG